MTVRQLSGCSKYESIVKYALYLLHCRSISARNKTKFRLLISYSQLLIVQKQLTVCNQLSKVHLENDWNSKANDFLVLVRRNCYSADDDSVLFRYANEIQTKIIFNLCFISISNRPFIYQNEYPTTIIAIEQLAVKNKIL